MKVKSELQALTVMVLSLIESCAGQSVDGVARVGAGDLLLASNVAGRVGATDVVHEDGVGPVGLDGGIAIVHALHSSHLESETEN